MRIKLLLNLHLLLFQGRLLLGICLAVDLLVVLGRTILVQRVLDPWLLHRYGHRVVLVHLNRSTKGVSLQHLLVQILFLSELLVVALEGSD